MGNLVEVKNNQVVTTSRQVAENFGKAHKSVLRSIHALTSAQNCANVFQIKEMFFEATESDTYGRQQKIYYMNRDGFSLLVMGFTGQKAIEWKVKYIQAFNQMEQALKERHTTAPVSVFQKYTYEGKIFMPAMYLMTMTKVSNSTFLLIAKRFQLPYISLQGEKLAAFKQENHLVHSSASRMILYPQKTIIGLLNYQQMYDKYKEEVRQYFTPEQKETWDTEDREAVFCTTQQFEQAAQEIHKTLTALDALVGNFEKYRRTPEEHTMYWNICRELRIKLMSQFATLKQSTPFINE